MSARHRTFASTLSLLLIALLTLPWAVAAQTAPASASSSATAPAMPMTTMGHGDMAHMSMATPATDKKKEKSAKGKPAAHAATMDHMHGMNHSAKPNVRDEAPIVGMSNGAMQNMDHPSPADGSMDGMSMGSMQGGRAPQDARSPDYSDGVGYGAVQAHMGGNDVIGKLLIDQLEAFDGRDGHGQSWELEGWYGTDANKLWLRSEGERSAGKLQDGDVEASGAMPLPRIGTVSWVFATTSGQAAPVAPGQRSACRDWRHTGSNWKRLLMRVRPVAPPRACVSTTMCCSPSA
ncbi:copper resistance B [Rhodanobacter sp. 115]|nr:copper resistance B [Rhodanobacter sp. 115]